MNNTASKAAAALGKLGGSVISEAKTEAARENGKLGGRPSPYRRVSDQRGVPSVDAIYSVPDTDHWANWRDAGAVVRHGKMVAFRATREVQGRDGGTLAKEGDWITADYERVDRDLAAQFSRLKSVGIATR